MRAKRFLTIGAVATAFVLAAARPAQAIYLFYMREDLAIALAQNPESLVGKQVVFTDELVALWAPATERPNRLGGEQYALFSRYVMARHHDGDMADMDFDDYRAMVEESPVETAIIEFRDDSADGRLVGACLVDWLSSGVSAVYSYFDPQDPRRGLGTYMILWLADAAARRGLPYVYLGYWIADSSKMAYKRAFRPLEFFGPEGWMELPTV